MRSMKKIFYLLVSTILIIGYYSCKSTTSGSETMKQKRFISEKMASDVSKSLLDSMGESNRFRVERGVNQVAAIWLQSDGTVEDFNQFCRENFTDKMAAGEMFHK